MATFTVTSNLDSGTGTLRDDLAKAGNGDIINFAPDVTNIQLESSLAIVSSVTIEGHQGGGTGAPGVTIDGQGKVTDFTVGIFKPPGSAGIYTAPNVTIDGLVVRNGYVHGNVNGSSYLFNAGGVFINNAGSSLTLSNSVFENNRGIGAPLGMSSGAGTGGRAGQNAAGGIYVPRYATLNLVGQTNVFTGNYAHGSAGGNGVGSGRAGDQGYEYGYRPYPPDPNGFAGGSGGAGAISSSGGAFTAAQNGNAGSGPYGGAGGIGGDSGGFRYSGDGKKGTAYANNSRIGAGGGGGGGNAFADVGGKGTINGAPVCFVSGTMIRTAQGDVAVENLQVGELALTASGAARAIVWIGHRTIACATHRESQPVRIAPNAFGVGVPARALLLSPGHPVLVEADEDGTGGHLVPIMCLINGTTIERVSMDSVTYWHVELDQHDILLAEGLPAESYLDWGDRVFFTEGSDHALANPDFVVPGLAGRCRPVALDGPVVEAARRRLDTAFAIRLSGACAWPTCRTDTTDFLSHDV